jgi:uncharacterized membrane protein YqjE
MTTTAEDTQAVLAIIQRLHSEIAELQETRLKLIDELVCRDLQRKEKPTTVTGLVSETDLRFSLARISLYPDLGYLLVPFHRIVAKG